MRSQNIFQTFIIGAVIAIASLGAATTAGVASAAPAPVASILLEDSDGTGAIVSCTQTNGSTQIDSRPRLSETIINRSPSVYGPYISDQQVRAAAD